MKVGLSSTLHDGPRRLPWTSLPRLVLAVAALVANGAMASVRGSLVLLAVAAVLLILDGVPLKRAWPFALALLSGLAFVMAGWLAGMAGVDLIRLAARLAAGLAWIAWAGITCRWPEIRRVLERIHLDEAAQTVEAAVVHGELVLGELQRGREAVLLRHAGRNLRPRTIGILLAGAIERAFDRAKALDSTRALRTGAPGASGGEPMLALEHLTIDGCCGPARLLKVSLSVGTRNTSTRRRHHAERHPRPHHRPDRLSRFRENHPAQSHPHRETRQAHRRHRERVRRGRHR